METDDLRNIPIFFIFGRPRSGTTLLTQLFNAHPNVRIAPEFPVMLFLYQRFRKVKKWDEATIRMFVDHIFIYSKFTVRRVENLKLDKEYIVNELLKYKDTSDIRVFLKSLNYFSYSVFSKEKTILIGDKNPIYSIYLDRLRNIFPDSRFICIIRDYRDNFISMQRLAEKDIAVEAPVLSLQIARWRYFTRLFLDRKRRFPDKYYILRYEDLVTDQEATYRKLCDFLGIEFNPSVFDFYKKKDEVNALYSTTIWDKFHENLLKPVNTSRMNTWQDKLSKREVTLADQIAGKYADKMGYERHEKGFHIWLFLRSLPMLTYNYILLGLMIFGTYLPARAGQWWFFNSTILLKTWLKIFGKKKSPAL